MIHADLTLARRLESLICSEFHRIAETGRDALPSGEAECVDLAGGVALWVCEGSPVNQAAGQGMGGPVTEAGLKRVEAFYHERGAAALLGACPLADPSLVAALGSRGWRVAEFEHVMVMGLTEAAHWKAPAAPPESVEVRECEPSERAVWAEVAEQSFSEGRSPARDYDDFGAIMTARPDATLVMGWVDGRPAGTGALVVDGGVGWLSGDSTLPEYRGRGLQQAIQRHRLLLACEAGCDLAVTEASPGGASQRNMERLGFRVAYTHVEFAKPALVRTGRPENSRS